MFLTGLPAFMYSPFHVTFFADATWSKLLMNSLFGMLAVMILVFGCTAKLVPHRSTENTKD